MSGQRIGIGQARARASDPILPIDALLAKVDDSITPRQVNELVKHLCTLMKVDPSLVLNLLSIIQTSANLGKAAGWVLMAVAATIVYLFLGAASHDTGGKELPLGPPILHA